MKRSEHFTLSNGAEGVRFYCIGCKESHAIYVKGMPIPWTWNGSLDSPTIAPSILVTSTRMTEDGERQCDEWFANGKPQRDDKFDSVKTVCHSFVVDGKIQYLNDCTHVFAGQTIDLPEVYGDG